MWLKGSDQLVSFSKVAAQALEASSWFYLHFQTVWPSIEVLMMHKSVKDCP